MQLSDDERGFLLKRTRFVRSWRYVGALMLALLAGFALWLFFTRPLLANPFAVIAALNNDSIPESTLLLMAGMLPIVILVSLVLAAMILLFVYAAFSNEKKYLKLIEQISNGDR